MIRILRPVMLWLAVAGLTACASAPVDDKRTAMLIGTPLEGCCDDAETFPPLIVALIEPAAPLLGQLIGNAKARAGYLDGADARREVRSRLRPLDLLAYSNKGRASGGVIPGLFGHIAVYLGTEAELRRLGAWHAPRVQPHHAAIRAGANFIEADQNGVHLSYAATALDTDRVVVTRPRQADRERRIDAVGSYAERVGGCFDFHFDNATPKKIYCSELIAQVMPELDLPERRMYGRMTTLPDDIVALTAVQRSRLNMVTYIRGTPAGWEVASRQDLISDLLYWWKEPRKPPPHVPDSSDTRDGADMARSSATP